MDKDCPKNREEDLLQDGRRILMMRRISWLILLASSLLLLTSGTVWGLDIFGDKPPPVMLVMTSDTTAMDANNMSILDAILGREDPSIADHPDLWLLERPEETKSSVIKTHIGDIRRLYVAGDNEGISAFDVAERNGWRKCDPDVVWSARNHYSNHLLNGSEITAPQPVIKTLCEESGFNRNPAMIFI